MLKLTGIDNTGSESKMGQNLTRVCNVHLWESLDTRLENPHKFELYGMHKSSLIVCMALCFLGGSGGGGGGGSGDLSVAGT